jgi:putative transcriptional regulator
MYRYIDSGLRDVWLRNGYRKLKTPYGTGVSIDDVLGLHRAIARALVKKPGRLSGPEFRFIRKELELSQKHLAATLGADEQAVARWEKGKTKVPKMADRFLRAIFQETDEGNAHIRKMVDRLNEQDAHDHERMVLARAKADWKAEAA